MTEKQLARIATKLGKLLLSGTISTTGPAVIIDFDQTPDHLVRASTMATLCLDYLEALTPEDDDKPCPSPVTEQS